jgi:hypothetical protein
MNRPSVSGAFSGVSGKFFLGVLGTLLLVAPADASVLYGSRAGGLSGQLYILNQATGAVIQTIGPLNDASALNYGMTGLAFHPITGVLYGSTHNHVNANPATLRRLVTIDPSTAQVTVVGEFNLPVVPGTNPRAPTMSDIAFDSAGNLYGVGSIGANLYSINISTGQAAPVGSEGFDYTEGGGIAVSPAGVIHGTPHSDKYGTYDSTLGTFTFITNPFKPAGGTIADLDFDGGTLYGLNKGASSQRLVTIVPATGAVTDVGAVPIIGIDAIAFKPIAAADFNSDGHVNGVDYDVWKGGFGQALGATKSIGDADGDFDVDAGDFLKWQTQLTIGPAASPAGTGVPEPASLVLAVLSVAGWAGLAKRRRV